MDEDQVFVEYHKIPEQGMVEGEIDFLDRDFPDGRKVSVGSAEGEQGLFFELQRPLGDGRISLLQFRLSDEATLACIDLAAEILDRKRKRAR